MSIRNASVPVGATYAPTGGTATGLVVLSANAGVVNTFIGTSGVTPLTRTEIEFRTKNSKPLSGAPGGYSQGRSSALITVPKTLANLNVTHNTAKFEMSIDPETTQAEVNALKLAVVNVILDADFDQLWLNQSSD